MDKEAYDKLIKYIRENKGFEYVGNNQALIPVKELIDYIKCIYNNEV